MEYMTVKEQALNLINDSLLKSRRESDLDWTDIKDKHPIMEHSSDILRRYSTAWKLLEDWGVVDFSNINPKDIETPAYKETHELVAGGVQKSDKLIKMNAQQAKDANYILQAHGFDTEEWEIVNAKNNIWNVNSKVQGVQTLYSSKITVKPKNSGFNIDKFLEKIENIKPKYIKQPVESTERLLTISYVDLHFGINTVNDYQQKLDETIEIMESKSYDTIYVPIGNDLLHVNTFKNQTANGTQIESVDLDKASDDAYEFYTIVLDNALKNSKNVVADYIPGNHDSDISWMFVKMLAKQYPQIKWNTSIDAKKILRWKNIMLLNLHGESGMNRVANTLITEYRDLMVGANCVEIHSGHLHSEKVKDNFGILVRTLPTSAKTDTWHKNQSFEGAVKASQLFEYNKDKLKVIHYV